MWKMKCSMDAAREVDIAVGILVNVEPPELLPSAVNVTTMPILQTPSPKPMQPQLLLVARHV